jgi:RNA polymerase sigma-70 factor (ECF subfamily)
MLVANHNDADDIMQEVSVLMLEKFNSFKEGTDFLAWARTIARYKTLEFLKKKKRNGTVVVAPEVFDFLEQESQKWSQKKEEWIDAVKRCISLLPKPDRQLIKLRYYENINVKLISHRLGCSFQKVYRELSRVNGLLMRCVRKKNRSQWIPDEV